MQQRNVSYIFFLSSYIPTFLILFFQTLNQKTVAVYLMMTILIFFIGLIGFCATYENKSKNREIIIKNIEHEVVDKMNYVLFYIIPFIFLSVPTLINNQIKTPNATSITIVFGVLTYIYIKSNMYCINPILNLFYEIFVIESNSGELLIIITDKDTEFKSNDQFNATHIVDNIYFAPMNQNKAVKDMIEILSLMIFLLTMSLSIK